MTALRPQPRIMTIIRKLCCFSYMLEPRKFELNEREQHGNRLNILGVVCKCYISSFKVFLGPKH